ncbi:MAG TPA: phosphate acyltransferase PlsX [Thermoanaerobaculia bacterium]|jgi:glycerol-3-phosphate acyltransferase PlsX|nr:phosphate acyltransferase PlsX [Thermoanaerobaculia bacterium]
MPIAVDAMGGDFAPQCAVEGAVSAAVEDGAEVLLVGDRVKIEAELARLGKRPKRIEIVHAEEVVGMDEPAITPIRKKRRSSIRICAELVKEGRAQAMVTAGNTGAAMISAKMVIGTVAGVDRPALAAVLPNAQGRTVLLDVGANVGTKAQHLREFAVMGHFYAQEVIGTPSPRVGLMSIGEEEGKGTDLTREVFKVLKNTGLNFVGNVEGRDVFNGSVDVIVCDGFVGNVILKSAEAVAEMVGKMLREEIERGIRTKVGYLFAKPAFDAFRKRTDYSEFGAAPLLGVNGGCFIGHGRSNAHAIQNAIRRATEFSAVRLDQKIRDKIAELHSQEARLLSENPDGPKETAAG